MTPEQYQSEFNADAAKRAETPLVDPEMTTPFDLVAGVTLVDDPMVDGDDAFEFDDAPGDFENDVLSRLENLENATDVIREAMEKVVALVEDIKSQVAPTLEMLTQNKLFKMLTGGK